MAKDTKRGYVDLPKLLEWNRRNGYIKLVQKVEDYMEKRKKDLS